MPVVYRLHLLHVLMWFNCACLYSHSYTCMCAVRGYKKPKCKFNTKCQCYVLKFSMNFTKYYWWVCKPQNQVWNFYYSKISIHVMHNIWCRWYGSQSHPKYFIQFYDINVSLNYKTVKLSLATIETLGCLEQWIPAQELLCWWTWPELCHNSEKIVCMLAIVIVVA